MFASKQRGTVIAKGLNIVGSVTVEGLVELNGQVEGEIHCTSLIVSRQAQVVGTIQAERVVVDGSVEGPIRGGQVVLKYQAQVVGDIDAGRIASPLTDREQFDLSLGITCHAVYHAGQVQLLKVLGP